MEKTLEERAKDVLAGFGTKEAYDRLRYHLLKEITEAEEAYSVANATAKQLGEALKLREQELLLEGVEGRNDKLREADGAVKASKDKEWLGHRQNIRTAQAAMMTAQIQGDQLRREWRAIMVYLELRIAQIRFLGGVDHGTV